MAPREFRHALDDMLAAITGLQRATAGKTLADDSSDWLSKHGVQRGIEIISEASRALPPEVRDERPDVPWPQVRAIGNVLRHDYHGLSDTILWKVVTDELPRLRAAVEALRARFGDGDEAGSAAPGSGPGTPREP